MGGLLPLDLLLPLDTPPTLVVFKHNGLPRDIQWGKIANFAKKVAVIKLKEINRFPDLHSTVYSQFFFQRISDE